MSLAELNSYFNYIKTCVGNDDLRIRQQPEVPVFFPFWSLCVITFLVCLDVQTLLPGDNLLLIYICLHMERQFPLNKLKCCQHSCVVRTVNNGIKMWDRDGVFVRKTDGEMFWVLSLRGAMGAGWGGVVWLIHPELRIHRDSVSERPDEAHFLKTIFITMICFFF